MGGLDFFQDLYDFHVGPKREKELRDKLKGKIRVIFMVLHREPIFGQFLGFQENLHFKADLKKLLFFPFCGWGINIFKDFGLV